jgi:hypothetical protein
MFYNAIKVTKMMDGVHEMKEFDSVTLDRADSGDHKALLLGGEHRSSGRQSLARRTPRN